MGYSSLQGFPMVASSPIRQQDALSNSPVVPPMGGPPGRHHGPNNMNPADIHSYEPPWKALCDFALHSDLDRLNPSTPNYQQLINQVNTFIQLFNLKEIVRNCRNMFHHYFLILSISLYYFVILNDISKISFERKWAVVCSTTPLHRDIFD